jgi:DNA-directed RNA polymerase specialized sigma24 family protein
MSEHMQELSDVQLVQRCLAGEQEAWEELRRRHIPALARFIQQQLHGRKSARARAEEMAEEVLESLLVPTPARLRRFQATRAPFPAYLRMLALQAVYLECRQDKRRKGRESALGQRDPADTWADDATTALLREEFVASLTPRELKYYRKELLGVPDPAGPCYFSPAQGYKLRQRILKKVKEFCKNEEVGRGGRKKVR